MTATDARVTLALRVARLEIVLSRAEAVLDTWAERGLTLDLPDDLAMALAKLGRACRQLDEKPPVDIV